SRRDSPQRLRVLGAEALVASRSIPLFSERFAAETPSPRSRGSRRFAIDSPVLGEIRRRDSESSEQRLSSLRDRFPCSRRDSPQRLRVLGAEALVASRSIPLFSERFAAE